MEEYIEGSTKVAPTSTSGGCTILSIDVVNKYASRAPKISSSLQYTLLKNQDNTKCIVAFHLAPKYDFSKTIMTVTERVATFTFIAKENFRCVDSYHENRFSTIISVVAKQLVVKVTFPTNIEISFRPFIPHLLENSSAKWSIEKQRGTKRTRQGRLISPKDL